MTKFLALVSFLFILISCQNTENCQSSPASGASQNEELSQKCPVPENPGEENPGEEDPDEGPSEEVPHEALIFDANVGFTNFEVEDEEKVYKALEIIKKVIASPEFRNKVINFTYDGEKRFVDNNNLTNEEIYQKLLDGAEELRPEIDHMMNLNLELYYSSSSTIGYTYPSVLHIWMNTKYFDVYSPSEVAGNIFHEWTHKLGFSHSSSYSVKRKSSVPYALGYLIRDLGKKFE